MQTTVRAENHVVVVIIITRKYHVDIVKIGSEFVPRKNDDPIIVEVLKVVKGFLKKGVNFTILKALNAFTRSPVQHSEIAYKLLR